LTTVYFALSSRYPAFRAPVAVLGRDLDGTESVDGDAEHGVDGAQTDGVVERQPQVAEHRTKRPVLSHQQIDRVKRHRDGADEEIADGQRSDEVVGRLANVALDDKRKDYDQVAAHGDDAGCAGQ